MITKRKIFIGISVVAVLIIGGWVFWSSYLGLIIRDCWVEKIKGIPQDYCQQASDCKAASHLGACININFHEQIPPGISMPAFLFNCDCIDNKCVRVEFMEE